MNVKRNTGRVRTKSQARANTEVRVFRKTPQNLVSRRFVIGINNEILGIVTQDKKDLNVFLAEREGKKERCHDVASRRWDRMILRAGEELSTTGETSER